MKKIGTVLLAAAMMAALCSCGGSQTASTTAAPAASAETKAAETKAEETKAPETEAPKEEAKGPTAEKPVTLKFGNSSAPDKLGSVVMEAFCKEVTEKTGGAVVCEWYPASQLGNGTQQIEATMADNQGGVATAVDSYSTYCNDLGILSVPFLFEDPESVMDFMASEKGQGMLDSLANDSNLKVLNYEFIRLPRVLISSQDITHPSDLKGKKFRVANIPLQAKMFEYWGGTVNQIGFADYPEALMQGVVNAGETSSESFSTSKFHLYAPYIAEVNFQYPLDCIVMSNNAFESLSSEQQQIMLDAAQHAADTYNERCYSEFEEYRPTMIEEGAIFLDIDRQEWIDSMAGFYKQLEDEKFFQDPELMDYCLKLKEAHAK